MVDSKTIGLTTNSVPLIWCLIVYICKNIRSNKFENFKAQFKWMIIEKKQFYWKFISIFCFNNLSNHPIIKIQLCFFPLIKQKRALKSICVSHLLILSFHSFCSFNLTKIKVNVIYFLEAELSESRWVKATLSRNFF